MNVEFIEEDESNRADLRGGGDGSVQRSSEMYKDFLLSFYGYVVFINNCNQF